MTQDEHVEATINRYRNAHHDFKVFLATTVSYFSDHPDLVKKPLPTVHSMKCRLKDSDDLRGKLDRKWNEGKPVTADNIFEIVTDLAGVRLLHLHTAQFPKIHDVIMKRVSEGDWRLHENPVAYTWDPEAKDFYEELNITPEIKSSYYTSVHYVIRPPRHDSIVACEIQVRTLFEEVWGEIDHTINYPGKTDILACREQLKVLAKLVSTGTRLADSIFRTHADLKN